MTEAQSDPVASSGSTAAAISNMVVRRISEYTGHGPTKARTHISVDLITVVLADTLTKGERSLVRDGESARVLDMRKAFQRTMRDDLVAGVQDITGRTVIAFFSDNHIDPDMAIESFALAPQAAQPDPGALSDDGAAPPLTTAG